MSVQGTSALCTQTKIVENTTLMGTQTCTPNHCQGGNETLATQATSKLSFNPHTSLPFVETDDRKRFPCLNIV